MPRPWLAHYPAGIPHETGPLPFESIAGLLEDAFRTHAGKPAFRFMGAAMTYAELDRASARFAGYLQSIGLQPGDRVALMMPNVFQYPVALAGVLRAGMVVVNTNPLYTPRELAHQLTDSGARAIVILENMAKTLEACRGQVPVEHVVVTGVGDMLPGLKGHIVNLVLRHVKKAVPAYSLPGAIRWKAALKTASGFRAARARGGGPGGPPVHRRHHGRRQGRGADQPQHRRQRRAVPALASAGARRHPGGRAADDGLRLPLYHIFGFTVNMMLSLHTGGCNLLIPNPRDIPALLKELKAHRFHLFPAVNTLFGAIARHPDVASVDWTHLRLSVGGGMAVQKATADLWKSVTGCAICEGYGLSETSPVACANPVLTRDYSGMIGMPVPAPRSRSSMTTAPSCRSASAARSRSAGRR